MADTQEFTPLWVSPPGDTIADALKERRLSLAEFARQLGQPIETVDALLAGRLAITIGTARRLQQILGASVEFWITRDSQFREDVAKREASEATAWLSELPIADMVRFRWLNPPPGPADEYAACLRFFDVPDVRTWRELYAGVNNAVSYRTSRSLDSRPGSVAAWLRRGRIEASQINCAPWSPETFRETLTAIRALTREKNPRRFVPALRDCCADSGVAVVIVRPPAGCRASGATQFLNDNRALLILSSRYLTDDQFWFTFFHEAGHLLIHGNREVILEGLSAENHIQEEQASEFAAAILVPEHFQQPFLHLTADSRQVIRFARRLGISPGLAVGQLQHRGILRQNQLNGLKRRFVWTENELVSRERA